jgi:hypothetical protein
MVLPLACTANAAKAHRIAMMILFLIMCKIGLFLSFHTIDNKVAKILQGEGNI